AVLWTSGAGLRDFVSALQSDYNIDMSQWSDVHPFAISPDGSRIAGHGINPNGNRQGFMITIPANVSNKWSAIMASSEQVNVSGNWQTTANDSVTTSEAGAMAEVSFEGSRLRYFATKGADKGLVDIYIDDVLWTSIDLYSCNADTSERVYESDYLGEGSHTLRLVATGMKHKASQSTAVSLDKVEVEAISSLPVALAAPVAADVPPANWSIFDRIHNVQISAQAFNPPVVVGGAMTPPRFSEVVAADGSFSVEAWFSPAQSTTQGMLFDIDYAGLHASVGVKSGELTWTGKPTNGSVSAPLTSGVSYRAQWNHVVLLGNWGQGTASLYLNNTLVAEVTLEQNGQSQLDEIHVIRDTDTGNYLQFMGQLAKMATYSHELSATQVSELYSWPTRYGLEFAPIGFPEYSTRLPHCSGGCEPGQDVQKFGDVVYTPGNSDNFGGLGGGYGGGGFGGGF
ncbi:MAG: LamG-like jellyroll fold domain-containing protein, partial [Oleiphilaceae bacterium]|nr:LamG-like jellyroll fold domain-containing protein [Oleiphilaceae bacterium]